MFEFWVEKWDILILEVYLEAEGPRIAVRNQ